MYRQQPSCHPLGSHASDWLPPESVVQPLVVNFLPQESVVQPLVVHWLPSESVVQHFVVHWLPSESVREKVVNSCVIIIAFDGMRAFLFWQ